MLILGPFQENNAEEIDNDVNDMWRLMYKLNKTFSDVVGPRTIADKIRRKIDQFKTHLPLLHVICNPGMIHSFYFYDERTVGVSWCHGVMVSWCHGVMVSWCHGVMVSWCHHVIMAHASMASLCHGITA